MTILVLGTPDSGKSAFAEKKVIELSGEDPRYYIATMIPFGEKGQERVKKHRAMRAGKGFITIECPTAVHTAIDGIPKPNKATCLLECMSNLIGNEMHAPTNRNDAELTSDIIRSVRAFSEQVKHLVIVTNAFLPDDAGYDEDTRRYVRIVDMVNGKLRQCADEVYTVF